jgi:pyruvate/2-oxoglutarate/acetoin dehydrogenase E1 component
VIAPRTLKPLDRGTIFESVRQISRAVVVSDACQTCGFGSELAATISGECFFDLDAPVRLVCGEDVPAPVANGLQRAVMVSGEDIVSECREVLRI